MIQVELSGFRTESRKQSTNVKDTLTAVKHAIEQLAPQLEAINKSQGDGRLAEVKSLLDKLLKKDAPQSPEYRILKGLRFEKIYDREERVQEAEPGTYEWILGEDDADCRTGPADRTFTGGAIDLDREQQSHARSCLLSWLRSENHVFHISGKAGSGKSTLMKFLKTHPRTTNELRCWAGDKRLVQAHFFFWRSDNDELQYSLKGLYRSILFETLVQCPELIRAVFPEVYETFSREQPGSCIQELSFPKSQDIEDAFGRLVSTAVPAQYRFCFFIDGLDEYKGYGEDTRDQRQHEKLAKLLTNWASKDNVKILASSRPYRQFEDTFSHRLRIHMHQLTRPDILLFAHRELNDFEDIREFCLPLCHAVVDSAEGVFLWAVLVVKRLCRSIVPYVRLESLTHLLGELPRDLENLYGKLLERLEESDRLRAYKMLLVVCEAQRPLNALAVSWLDDWDHLDFPASEPPREYEEDEVGRRLRGVNVRLDNITQNLITCVRDPHDLGSREPSFFKYRLQLYHRSVRDFIRKNKDIQDLAERLPSLTNGELHLRLQLADIWFAPRHAFLGGWNAPKIWQFGGPGARRRLIPEKFLTGLQVIFERQCRSEDGWCLWSPKDLYLEGRRPGHATIPGEGEISVMSFDHWTVWASEAPIRSCRGDSKPPPKDLWSAEAERREKGERGSYLGPSSLLTAAIAGHPAAVNTLLNKGHSPDEEITIRMAGQKYSSSTIWMVYCGVLADAALSGNATDDDYLVLEHFLRAGRADGAGCSLVLRTRHHRNYSNAQTLVTSLRQLVARTGPRNVEQLLGLMDGAPLGDGDGDGSGSVWLHKGLLSAGSEVASEAARSPAGGTSGPRYAKQSSQEEHNVSLDLVPNLRKFRVSKIRCGGVELKLQFRSCVRVF